MPVTRIRFNGENFQDRKKRGLMLDGSWWEDEGEYVYELNKWCRVKGFQTKFRSGELD